MSYTRDRSSQRVACPSCEPFFAFVLAWFLAQLVTLASDHDYFWPLLTGSILTHSPTPPPTHTPGMFRPIQETLGGTLAGPLPPRLFWGLKEAPKLYNQ